MYYLIYWSLYLVSLLPNFILYGISDFFYFIIYYIIGYRKDVVFANLDIAFPEKTKKEKIVIAKKFYINFIDTFIETIKMVSMSDNQFSKMVEIDLDKVIAIANKGKSIQFHAGHQFNWELANWSIAQKMPIPFVGVYMKISNPHLNKIFYDLRQKKGTILVATHEFRNRMHQLLSTQYSIGLAADQNPGIISNGFWLHFFGRPVPFVTGPDKGAIKNNTAVVFVELIKVRRGKYRFETTVIAEDTATLKEGQLTCMYRDLLEATIRKNPDNYLWTHRRWKSVFEPFFVNKWIDVVPPPTM